MPDRPVPVSEFFGAIYGHFFPNEEGRPGALFDDIQQALRDEHHARLAATLMDYLAGDVEVQWITEDEERDGGPSFRLPEAEAGGLDLVALARERRDIYLEAFQVAVARLSHRERSAYDAYFRLVLEVFEQRFGSDSAPIRSRPS